jgi:hypothetical protein
MVIQRARDRPRLVLQLPKPLRIPNSFFRGGVDLDNKKP